MLKIVFFVILSWKIAKCSKKTSFRDDIKQVKGAIGKCNGNKITNDKLQKEIKFSLSNYLMTLFIEFYILLEYDLNSVIC